MANAQITGILTSAANANGIPPALLLAQAQQESSGNPNAYNASSGATGLLQLEPATAASLGVTDPTDPTQNANGGASYLAQLYAKFGSWTAALAAYDWGPTAVSNAMAKYGSNWLSYAPSETTNYVSTILGNSGVSDSPDDGATDDSGESALDDLTDVFLPNIAPPISASGAAPAAAGPSVSEILLLTAGGLVAYLIARDLFAL